MLVHILCIIRDACFLRFKVKRPLEARWAAGVGIGMAGVTEPSPHVLLLPLQLGEETNPPDLCIERMNLKTPSSDRVLGQYIYWVVI